MNNWQDLNKKVIEWSVEREIVSDGFTNTPKINALAQLAKLAEEMGELSGNISRNKPHGIKDDIGDMLVVLINLGVMYGLSLEDCLEHAYNEIKDRKGKMIDGTFVKESDLKIKTKIEL